MTSEAGPRYVYTMFSCASKTVVDDWSSGVEMARLATPDANGGARLMTGCDWARAVLGGRGGGWR